MLQDNLRNLEYNINEIVRRFRYTRSDLKWIIGILIIMLFSFFLNGLSTIQLFVVSIFIVAIMGVIKNEKKNKKY